MLHLIPASLHRLAYRIAHALRKCWWRIARPRLYGVRVLAIDPEGRVLLVRHSYGSGRWSPPGGGMRKGEDACVAGLRELREETGCTIDGIYEIAVVEERLHGTANVVRIVGGPVVGTPHANLREIVETRFCALDALPEAMPPYLRAGLPGWITAATIADRPAPAAPPVPPPEPTG